MISAPLEALTDRDLLLNLYLTLTMVIEDLDIDAASCMQQLVMEQEPHITDDVVTLEQIMADLERRLGIENTEYTVMRGREH